MTKVAVYKDEDMLYPNENPFMYILDSCDGISDHRAGGALMRDCFDENGICIFNQDCRDEASSMYDGWGVADRYCVSLKEHRRRLKKSKEN